MKTAPKVVNNLLNENIFPVKVSSLKQDGITNYAKYISHAKSFNIPVFIGLSTLC